MEMTGWQAGFGQDSTQEWFRKGQEALSGNKAAEAAEFFGMVLKDNPFSAEAHRALSKANWAQGKTEDALNSLTRALELDPNDREAVTECARLFSALGKSDFAMEVLQSYLDRNPLDDVVRSQVESLNEAKKTGQVLAVAEFFKQQGEIQYERGNLAHATACFEMAIENDPGMASAHNSLGVIYWEGNNLEKALEHFYKAMELNPEDPEVLGNSARALAKAGESDTAVQVYREYLTRSPGDTGAWEEYESLIATSAAPKWSAEGLTEEVADIYIDVAKRLKDTGDLAGAADAIEKALKIRPEAIEALLVLASLHNAIGQVEDAEAILNQALLIDPSHLAGAEMLKAIRNGNGAAA